MRFVRSVNNLGSQEPGFLHGQKSAWAAILLTLTLSSPVARAVDNPASFKLGETDVSPQVRLGVFSSDNALYEEDGGETSSGYYVEPSVSWLARRRTLTLEANYDGSYSQEDVSTLDYTDHALSLRALADISKRLRTDSRLSFVNSHQDPGDYISQINAGQIEDVLEYDRLAFTSYLTYGARNALGNIRFGLQYYDTDYKAGQSPDLTSLSPEARFSLRVSQDTRAFVSVRYTQVEYDQKELDRNRISTETGLLWEITDKTAGALSVGISDSDYPEIEARTNKTTIAQFTGNYSPTVANQLEFNISRSLQDEGNITVEQVISDNIALAWRYDWNSRFFHRAEFSVEEIDRGNCPEQGQRLSRTGLELDYKFRRWLIFGGKFSFSRNDVVECDGFTINDPINDYDTRTFGLFLEASL